MISDSFFIVWFSENNPTDFWSFLPDAIKHLFYSAYFKIECVVVSVFQLPLVIR